MIFQLVAVTFVTWVSTLVLLKLLKVKNAPINYSVAIIVPCLVAGFFLTQQKEPEQSEAPQIIATTPKTESTITTERSPKELRDTIAIAGTLISEEKFDQAIDVLNDAIKIKEHDDLYLQLSATYFAKGLLYAEEQQYQEALGYLDIARTKAPQGTPFLEDIGTFEEIINVEISKLQEDAKDPNAIETTIAKPVSP